MHGDGFEAAVVEHGRQIRDGLQQAMQAGVAAAQIDQGGGAQLQAAEQERLVQSAVAAGSFEGGSTTLFRYSRSERFSGSAAATTMRASA